MASVTPAAASRPPGAAKRRIGLAEGSARSLLLTLLGEFVLPTGSEAWTSTMITSLGLLGVEEKAARQAVARAGNHDWISSRRIGRHVRWRLTESGARLLTEGAARIYEFDAAPARWDGRWLILLASVPESRRRIRHHLRTRLQWAGFGSPLPGVWLSPRTDREAEVRSALVEFRLEAATSFIGAAGSVGDAAALARQAWDLDALAARYGEFLDAFSTLRPSGDEESFVAQASIVHAWRRFPSIDPGLPRAVLPDVWIGADATRMFRERHARWEGPALRHWTRLQELRRPG